MTVETLQKEISFDLQHFPQIINFSHSPQKIPENEKILKIINYCVTIHK